jgi:hypothetical protein
MRIAGPRLSAMRLVPKLAFAVLVLLVGCSRSPVVLPADSAPPAVVLNAYLTAIVAHDCDTARTLETKDYSSGHDCGIWHMTAFGDPVGPETPRDGEAVFSTTVTTQGGEKTLPDGHHTLFFNLIRQPGGAWRVAGGGTGP